MKPDPHPYLILGFVLWANYQIACHRGPGVVKWPFLFGAVLNIAVGALAGLVRFFL